MKKFKISLAIFVVFTCFCCVIQTKAQRRDYLTEAEIELVRDAQQIDLRVAVLSRAIDRRFAVINNQTPKEKSEWGELPKGTRTELLIDIEKLLQKSIDDIDDVAARSKDSKFFPKAVNHLADKCREYQPQFKTFFDKAENEKEKGALLGSMQECNDIIEASSKVPKEEKKKN